MGHVDDPHLAEDDRQTEGHEQEDRERLTPAKPCMMKMDTRSPIESSPNVDVLRQGMVPASLGRRRGGVKHGRTIGVHDPRQGGVSEVACALSG